MIMEILWDLVATIGLGRGFLLWREAIKDRRALGQVENGRGVIASAQVEEAWMSCSIWLLLLLPGVLALAYHLGMASLKERLSIVPLFLVAALLMLFLRQERRVYFRNKLLAGYKPVTTARQIDNIEEKTEDTNRMIREDRVTGDVDRGEEQTDRKEGREHRGFR